MHSLTELKFDFGVSSELNPCPSLHAMHKIKELKHVLLNTRWRYAPCVWVNSAPFPLDLLCYYYKKLNLMVITRFLGWRNSKKKAAWNLSATYLGNKLRMDYEWDEQLCTLIHLPIVRNAAWSLLPDSSLCDIIGLCCMKTGTRAKFWEAKIKCCASKRTKCCRTAWLTSLLVFSLRRILK